MRTTLLLCLSAVAWSCAQRPPIDSPSDAGTDDAGIGDDVAAINGNAGSTSHLTFSSAPDGTSRALTALVKQYQTAPHDDAALQLWLQAGADARAAIHANPDAAATAVLTALAGTRSDLGQRAVLFELLQEVGTQQALDALSAAALEPVIDDPSEVDVELENRASYEARRIRHAAVDALGRAARGGNQRARAPLTDVALHAPETQTQQRAIDAVLQTAPLRRRAKADLAAQLPASQHYLLHGSL